MATLAIYIDAGNTTNGNPRRGWLITDSDGQFETFVDEGYEGVGSLRLGGYDRLPRTPKIAVTPAVYKDAYNQSYGAIDQQMKKENRLHRKLR